MLLTFQLTITITGGEFVVNTPAGDPLLNLPLLSQLERDWFSHPSPSSPRIIID